MENKKVLSLPLRCGLRTQTFIGDKQYMRGMIPHHSSAILTISNADIKPPEVKKLAEDIIKAQERETALMKQYLDRLNQVITINCNCKNYDSRNY